jgi:hypothetical protein
VIRKLFRRDDIPPSAKFVLFASAIQRLRRRLADDEATFLLRSCLQYRIEEDTLKRELVSLAIDWLESHHDNPKGDYVWNRVLRYRPNLVSDVEWLRVARYALAWLTGQTISDHGFEQTTNSLLMRPHLLEPTDREYVIKLGIKLIGTDLHPEGRRRMVASLEWLARSLAEDDPLKRQIDEALGPS